jgi:hypothetical protein
MPILTRLPLRRRRIMFPFTIKDFTVACIRWPVLPLG